MAQIIYFQKETEERALIQSCLFALDILTPEQLEEEKQKGIYYEGDYRSFYPGSESVPKGKAPILYINPQTKEIWYELENRPLTQEEIMQEQNEKIDLLLQMQMSSGGVI